jgi:inosine-uridine nucleoside N-ribohydrolase
MVTSLIIDTDPGIDDILGILLALGSPDKVKIEAITLNFGNTDLKSCESNILRTFNLLHQHVAEDPEEDKRRTLAKIISKDAPPILLSNGAAKPLGGRQFTAAYFHGRDGISGISQLPGDPFPRPNDVPSPLIKINTSAHEVILDILAKHPPGTVRIAAVGPLTNIALAWEKDPETFLRVGGISVMGCSLDLPGNTTPLAEFNTFADPFAARKLLHDAPLHPLVQQRGGRLPIDLLPLDITCKHTVPFNRLCDDDNLVSGIMSQYRKAIMGNPRKHTNSFAPVNLPFDPARDDLFVAHDPLAIAHAMYCPSFYQRGSYKQTVTDGTFEGWKIKTRCFGIETEGTLTRGMCVVDRRQLGKAKKGMNKAQEDSSKDTSQEEEPTDGEWDVVVDSPGPDWFADIFCSALGI